MATNTYRRYTQAYQKAAVNTVDQKKLIVMLYDGAIKFLSLGVKNLEATNFMRLTPTSFAARASSRNSWPRSITSAGGRSRPICNGSTPTCSTS